MDFGLAVKAEDQTTCGLTQKKEKNHHEPWWNPDVEAILPLVLLLLLLGWEPECKEVAGLLVKPVDYEWESSSRACGHPELENGDVCFGSSETNP